MELATIIVSSLAIAVSGWSVWTSRKAAIKAREANKKLAHYRMKNYKEEE